MPNMLRRSIDRDLLSPLHLAPPLHILYHLLLIRNGYSFVCGTQQIARRKAEVGWILGRFARADDVRTDQFGVFLSDGGGEVVEEEGFGVED